MRRRGGRARGQKGFTLIEVMMAIAVMTVGAMGIMALQQATTRGTGAARSMTVATQVNRTWVERLRRDALRWGQKGTSGLSVASGPKYLDAVPNPGAGSSGWHVPVDPSPDPDETQSYGSDYRGNDTTDSNEMRFCTHIDLRWGTPGDTIRVDVRTWWARRGDASVYNDYPDCANGSEDTITAALDGGDSRVRSVRSTVLVRRNPIP